MPAFLIFIALIAFILMVFVPAATLLLAPLLLGLPHVASDIYLLFIREQVIPRWIMRISAVLALVISVNAVVPLVWQGVFNIDDNLLLAVLVAAPMLCLTCYSQVTWVSVVTALIVLAILVFPNELKLIMAYAHNFVALAFWVGNYRGDVRARWGVMASWLVLFAVGIGGSIVTQAVIFTPVTDVEMAPFWSLVPDPSHRSAGALLFTFGFTQLIHLCIWAILLPWIALPRQPRFVALSAYLVVGIVVGVVIMGAEPKDLPNLRRNYLLLVSFHGWFEVAWILMRAHMREVSNGSWSTIALTACPGGNVESVG